MAQQREAMTDRLVGIIASIKMGRRSGQLIVRRGEGLTAEEGTLTFVQGQVVQAHVGRRSGSDALNWLSTWGLARYIFESLDSDKEMPAVVSPLSSPSSERKVTSPLFLVAPVNTDKLEAGAPQAPTQGVPSIIVELSEATARIDRAGLSRAHRHLYLLIDGHRTVLELVPLVGRRVEDVRNMLHDLEWLGVIQIANPPFTEL
ncbi:MAG TPA: DUF4388 domain-containing protein [Ktedonobacteraceae bacterium]|nr:DUF4388 domain-containing protein [Ktedonobacteraceae bacterium]